MAWAHEDTSDLGFRVDGLKIVTKTTTDPGKPDDVEKTLVLHRLLQLNHHLEKQIEILRLRSDFETKRNEKSKSELKGQYDVVMREKEERLQCLKSELRSKEGQIENLVAESESKSEEIRELQIQITDLHEEADKAKQYVQQLQKDLSFVKEESGYKEKENEISALRTEIESLLRNLTLLEKEVQKCREIINNQRGKIKYLDGDKKGAKLKFKEELNKVSQTMRLEIERLRDVMKNQWEEMKQLREQNETMHRDIKEIKEILVSSSLDSGDPPTNRQYRHSSFAIYPHLPKLKNDTKRILPGKKKH